MLLWTINRKSDGQDQQRSFYKRIFEFEAVDKRKRVTHLTLGEDRAMILATIMIFCSVVMYFIVGINILRSYSNSAWKEKANCIVLNSTIMWDMNCSYSCGEECWAMSRYPCLQVFVSVSGKTLQLLHNEETQESNPECFYIPKCGEDYSATHAVVQDISDRIRSQHYVDCFVDPTDEMDCAILTQIYGPVTIFNYLFWPTCTLVGAIVIIAMVKLTQFLFYYVEVINMVDSGHMDD